MFLLRVRIEKSEERAIISFNAHTMLSTKDTILFTKLDGKNFVILVDEISTIKVKCFWSDKD